MSSKFKVGDRVIILKKAYLRSGGLGFANKDTTGCTATVYRALINSKFAVSINGRYAGIHTEDELQHFPDGVDLAFNKLKKEVENEI